MLIISVLWWGSSRVIEGSFERQAEGWINKLDELATPLYTSEDKSYFHETVDYLRNFPEVASVQYYTAQGDEMVAEYYRNGDPEGKQTAFRHSSKELAELMITDRDSKPQLLHNGDASSIFHISEPIWIKSVASNGMFDFSLDEPEEETIKVIGVLRVGLDYSRYQRDLESMVLWGSALIIFLLVIAAYIGRILIRWALRPLRQLEEPLNRLANGETDVEVVSSGDREIVQIAKVLNTTIGALREHDETLRRMANHDPLTGLINRNYFQEQLELELKRIGRDGGSSALFFIDLDRFKFINDTYGHAAGDRLLVAVSNLLKHRMREGDLIGRFGGDEFVALVHRVDRKQAGEVAADLIRLMQEFKFHEAGDTLHIQFSVGVTVFDNALLTAHDVLLQADAAVHEAKNYGRNCFQIYESSEDNKVIAHDYGWHERITRVLEEQSLILYYQPLMTLGDAVERVCEVLLRMPDGKQNLLIPAAFFPAAERFGLMAEVDRQVIRKAAQWLTSLSEKDVVLSINLSFQSFEEKQQLDEYLVEIFSEFDINPRQFIFEIDEAVAVRHSEKVRPLMEKINNLGCQFAVDNFGAGYASFNYLKHCPVHRLNIDRMLIENLAQEPVHQIIVRAIVEAAHALGKQTVAKYVQDDLSLRLLKQFGVDYAQGNFLCEALPVKEKSSPELSVVRGGLS
ncbi:MAG: EAL domain-containing protein [Chromatiales bacterium]|nr:EAL domain-containing protein [Chromatiales bacterium]